MGKKVGFRHSFFYLSLDIMDLSGSLKPKKNKGVDPLKAREYMETHYERV